MQGLGGGRARGDASLDKRLGRVEKAVDLLDQRMQRQQRIPPATSGGIVGVSRCEAYSFQVQDDGIGSTIAVTE
ncbi:MAG TPA: hypothetical protein VIR15_07910, partial [Intrasporangium sp.]|uniref:hypothetical protein n=1 Tax=Intrasporangium sp. TaxID=1925024 RepID=UPI002F959810